MIRKADERDILPVAELYLQALDYEESHKKYTSWQRGIYPTVDTARAGVKHGTLYVMYDGDALVGAVVLDSKQPPEYKKVRWSCEARYDEVLVVHTLCVSPLSAGNGVGSRILDYAKELARERGCKTIRLNTTSKNKPAIAFYKKNGFSIADKMQILLNGQIRCPQHTFLNFVIK